MILLDNLSKEELETEIACNDDGLYEEYNEKKLLAGEYTREEILEVAAAWILAGNEAA